jgi:hypothetical protein
LLKIFDQSYGMENKKNKLFDQKISGDLKLIAQMMGITQRYAFELLKRPNAKRHQEAINALRKIIETRDSLLQK